MCSLGPCQTSMIKFLTKIVNRYKLLTTFAKVFLHWCLTGSWIFLRNRNDVHVFIVYFNSFLTDVPILYLLKTLPSNMLNKVILYINSVFLIVYFWGYIRQLFCCYEMELTSALNFLHLRYWPAKTDTDEK